MQRLLLVVLQRIAKLPRWLGLPGMLLLVCGVCFSLPVLFAYLFIRYRLVRWMEWRQLIRGSRRSASPAS